MNEGRLKPNHLPYLLLLLPLPSQGEAMCHLVRGEDVPAWLTKEGGPYFPPLLWHALDTWKSARQSHHQLMASLEHFLACMPLPHAEQV